MNQRTLQREDKAFAPMLYMVKELSNRTWKLLFGDGARRCQLSIAAGELVSWNEAVVKVRERFGLPARVQVVSCYEAGRVGHGAVRRDGHGFGIVQILIDRAELQGTDLADCDGIDEGHPDRDGYGTRGRKTGRQQQRHGGAGYAQDPAMTGFSKLVHKILFFCFDL